MRRLLPWLLASTLFAVSCPSPEPILRSDHETDLADSGTDPGTGPDTPLVDPGPVPDVSEPAEDTPEPPDGSDLAEPDTPIPPDTPADVPQPQDPGTPPGKCDVELVYDGTADTKVVFVSGAFNGWPTTPETATVLDDADGDHVFRATLHLDPGSYPYKFVVDGKWIADPKNPKTVDDGYGGKNSVLDVPSGCTVTPPPPPTCGETKFSVSAPGAKEVLLSGSFNSWGKDAQTADVMTDPDGDGTFEVTKKLAPGSYQYKFIVDGKWIADPNNPKTGPDGFGGLLSLLDVADCGALHVESHSTDPSGKFEAVLASGDGSEVPPAEVSVTVDHQPAPGAVSDDGAKVRVSVTGLAQGIHDVRVTRGGSTLLLKVYVGVSTNWADAVLYFAMTDRFSNGDKGNDKPVADVDSRTNYQGGDLRGIIGRIDDGYFSDLGVGALWISWPVDNPGGYEEGSFPDEDGCNLGKTSKHTYMRFTAYHGYWPSQTDQVEEHFGSLEDLQELVHKAHARGIRVMLDFTANHVHTSSPLYAAHKDQGWFNFPVEICDDVGWDTKPKTCWFAGYLADFNFNNADARKAVTDMAVDWVKKTGADGFRFDAVKHLEMVFVTDLRARLHAEFEQTGVPFYLVGETFSGDTGLIASFLGPDKLHGQFDFPSNLDILKTFGRQEEGLDTMDGNVRKYKASYGNALMSTFLGNHDMARFTSHAAGSMKCGAWDIQSEIAQGWRNPPGQPGDEAAYRKLQLAFTYLYTIPGVPLVYYGDEFGMPGAGDPDNRRFMRFGDDLSWMEKATLAYMRKLGKARAAHASLRTGTWPAPLWSEGGFLAYGRDGGTDKAVVLLNPGSDAKTAEVGVVPLGLADGTTMTDAVGDCGAKAVAGGKLSVTVPGRGACVMVTD